MTSLVDVLRRSEFDGLTDQQALDHGNATTFVLTLDRTPYTWSGIGEKLIANGVSATDVVSFATGISQLPGGAILDKCLASGGFDFGDATNRALIQSFEINEPQWAVNILEAMLAIGGTTGTLWQQQGITAPTLSDITAARAEMAIQQEVTNFMNNVFNPLVGSGTATGTSIKAAVNSYNWVS